MNQLRNSIFSMLILLVAGVFTSKGQDQIITKKGQEISSKVLEISLTTIRYKKAENLNGPIYNIDKNDVLVIKYQNGTKQVINESQTNQPLAKSSQKEFLTKEETLFKPIEKGKNISNSVNEKPTVPLIKENEPAKPTYSINYYKHKKRKTIWGIATLLSAGIGTYTIVQSGSLYKSYKSATTDASSIHNQIETLDSITPIAFGISGFSAIEFIIQSGKQSKELKIQVIPDKNAISGIRLGLSYSL